MSIGTEVLEARLSDSDFAETVSYVPAGAEEAARVSGIVVRIIRLASALGREDRAGKYNLFRAEIHVLAAVHATYKGIVSPAVGDKWKLAKVRGGSESDGWKCGTPQPRDGYWLLPVELQERFDTGGGHAEAKG